MVTSRRRIRQDANLQRQIERIRGDAASVEELRPPAEPIPEPLSNTRALLRERRGGLGLEAPEAPIAEPFPDEFGPPPSAIPSEDAVRPVDIDLGNGFVLTPDGFVQEPGAKPDPVAVLDRETGQLTQLAGLQRLISPNLPPSQRPIEEARVQRLLSALQQDIERVLGSTEPQAIEIPTGFDDERRFLGPSGEQRIPGFVTSVQEGTPEQLETLDIPDIADLGRFERIRIAQDWRARALRTMGEIFADVAPDLPAIRGGQSAEVRLAREQFPGRVDDFQAANQWVERVFTQIQVGKGSVAITILDAIARPFEIFGRATRGAVMIGRDRVDEPVDPSFQRDLEAYEQLPLSEKLGWELPLILPGAIKQIMGVSRFIGQEIQAVRFARSPLGRAFTEVGLARSRFAEAMEFSANSVRAARRSADSAALGKAHRQTVLSIADALDKGGPRERAFAVAIRDWWTKRLGVGADVAGGEAPTAKAVTDVIRTGAGPVTGRIPAFTPGGTAVPGQARPLQEIIGEVTAQIRGEGPVGGVPPRLEEIVAPGVTPIGFTDQIATDAGVKPPWQMTFQELIKNTRGGALDTPERAVVARFLRDFSERHGFVFPNPFDPNEKISTSVASQAHREVISNALAEGKIVPAEVLADFPDLAPETAEQPSLPRQIPGEPEAGVQAAAFGVSQVDVRPVGRGEVTQISLDDQLRLQEAREAAQPVRPIDVELNQAFEELVVKQELLKDDPIANFRVKFEVTPARIDPAVGRKRAFKPVRDVLLTSFLDAGGNFPEAVTVKQATALLGGRIPPASVLNRQGKVPREVALDEIVRELAGFEQGAELTADDVAAMIEQAAADKREIANLEARVAFLDAESLEPTEPTVVSRDVEPPDEVGLIRTTPQPIPEPETFVAEDAAIALVDDTIPPVPPKPPRSFIDFGDQQWERFDGMIIEQVPSSVPLSERLAKLRKTLEKQFLDPLARLNAISWDAEVAGTLTRAASGISQELYRQAFRELDAALGGDASLIRFVETYLTLRHQLEVLRATNRGVFKYTKGGRTQSFTPKQLQAMFPSLARRLGPEDYAKVKAGANVIPKLYHLLLRGSEELTPGQIEGLIKKFPFYNPILSETEATVADTLLDLTGTLNRREIKRLTEYNTDKETTSPLAALAGTINRRVAANLRNTALKAIAEGAVLNEKAAGGLITLTTKPPGARVAQFSYFDKGVRKFAVLGPGAEWIAKDIQALVAQPTHVINRWAKAVNGIPRKAFTTWNPGFVVTNTLFDGLTAYFTQGIGPGAFTKGLIQTVTDIFVEVEAVNRFRLAGGEVGGFFGEIEKAPSKFIQPKRTGLIKRRETGVITLKNPRDLKRFLNPFQLVAAFGHAGENAARIAAYEKGLKEGLSVPQAAVRGRRVTVDFPRMGEAVKVLNNWWLFLGAGVGGFMLPVRAVSSSPRSLARLAVLLAAYVGLTTYNQSYEEYDDVSDDTKAKWLFVMVPSDEYNKKGQKQPHLIRILPLREFGIVTGWIEYFMGKLRTLSPETYRTIAMQLEVWYPGWSPVSMITQSGAIEWPTQVISTTQQILANKDTFRDRELVPEELRILPVTQQYNQFTSSVAIRVGQALNISPIHLDFFFTNTLGSLGRDGLRALSLVVDEIMGDLVDPRIAELVKELWQIPVITPPQEIQVARETFLEGLDAEDRNLVLQMERVPTNKIPFIDSFIERFYKTHGGQVTRTAREIARETSPFEDLPPEALETLKKEAVQNAENLLAGKISNKQFDDASSRYRDIYSGGSTQDWRQAQIGGAVSTAKLDALLPEAYQRSEEFQAVSAYQQIRAELISQRGGVFDADAWDEIQQATLAQLRQFYTENAVAYALAHKDDWIDRLPEPARSAHRQRVIDLDDGSWFDDYTGEAGGLPPARRRTTPPPAPPPRGRQDVPQQGRSLDNTRSLLEGRSRRRIRQ